MWLVYALSAAVLTSILGTLFRVVALKSQYPRSFSFLFNFTIFVMTLGLIAIFGVGRIDLNPWLTLLLILSGTGYGVFQRYQFTVRKHIEASVMPIIAAPASLAGYLLAVLWLQEAVTPFRIIGYLLLTGAGFLAVKKKRTGFTFNHFIFLALFMCAALSIAGTLDRAIAPHFELALTYTGVLWFAQAFGCFVPFVRIKEIKSELILQQWRLPLLAIINLLALNCTISAIRLAPATKVLPVQSMNVVLTALLGIIFLKEYDRLLFKLAAAATASLGLILITH